jgi:arginase
MDVCLIQVPSMAGDERHPAGEGPARLHEAGATQLFADATVEQVLRGGPFLDSASASARVNHRLADIVSVAVAAGRLPIVLAGSCNAALGVVAGFDHERCGAVWIDAHADFNTPESTASGFFPGMTLAILTGHCYRDYWARIGDSTPLAEGAVVLFGVRDLSPEAERERLAASRLRVVDVGDADAELDELAERVEEVYLHVDFDGFAPEVAPGVVDEPVPGGLTLEDVEAIIGAVGARFRLRAATLATYTPERDEDARTLRLGLCLLALLADSAIA